MTDFEQGILLLMEAHGRNCNWDKMADILQKTVSNPFSCENSLILFKISMKFVPKVQLTISQQSYDCSNTSEVTLKDMGNMTSI